MEPRELESLGIPRSGLRGGLSLLSRNADFRNLYTAQLISFAGDWFLLVALYGLILDVTGSPVMASLVLIAQLVPSFLVSPIAGALVDRMNRQVLMIGADATRAVLCLGFLFVRHPGDIWIVYVLQVLLAVFGAVFEPASSAAVPNLVDPADLAMANTLVGSAWGTMLAVGAALGGLVAATLGRHAAFIGDAVSFAFSAALLIQIRRAFNETRAEEQPGIVAATVETVHYARRDHRVLALLAVKGGFGLAGGVLVLLPVFAKKVYHQGDAGIGVLYGFRGLGALIGPFIGRRIAGNTLRGLFIAIGIALASFGVFYGVFPLMPTLLAAGPLSAAAHLGGGAQWTLSTYGLQTLVPDRIRGRVFAFDFALVTLTITLSNLAAGWAAEAFGPRVAMAALAGVALVYSAVWWLATRRLRAELR
ncbi:MAG: MFS transporter [Actinomycetota bacterium]|nr:MFS transporter [Actinomycetota bacterium]